MRETTSLSRRELLVKAVLGSTACGLPSLLRAAEPKVSVPPYNQLSLEEETALGRKFSAEYEKHVEILRNPIFDLYLNSIIRKLGDASQAPFWPYQVRVVNTADINASALPGGFLYIQRGLLEWVQDENEMVGALAHEVGHVVARHTTNRLMLTFLARNLYETVKKNILLDNQIIAEIIERLGGPVLLLAQLKYSRENESEADLLGFYEMVRAGWHPNGLLKFFSRLQRVEGARNPVEVMLSDHPATAERVEAIQRELDSVRINAPLRQQTLQFQALKAALSLYPPAPKPRPNEKTKPGD